jgi:hypothetical protein
MTDSINVLLPADLDWLQAEQLRHDAIAHAHVVALPMRRQLVNFTLQLAKYQGRLLKALRCADTDSIQILITDSFIILLATANALGKSPAIFAAGRPTSLSHLRSSEALMLAYIEVVGEMSKACAAFDDHEDYPSHSMLHTGVSTLCRVVLALANVNQVPLLESIPHRWSRVERRARDCSSANRIADVA